jgi:hypothetical protein
MNVLEVFSVPLCMHKTCCRKARGNHITQYLALYYHNFSPIADFYTPRVTYTGLNKWHVVINLLFSLILEIFGTTGVVSVLRKGVHNPVFNRIVCAEHCPFLSVVGGRQRIPSGTATRCSTKQPNLARFAFRSIYVRRLSHPLTL